MEASYVVTHTGIALESGPDCCICITSGHEVLNHDLLCCYSKLINNHNICMMKQGYRFQPELRIRYVTALFPSVIEVEGRSQHGAEQHVQLQLLPLG